MDKRLTTMSIPKAVIIVHKGALGDFLQTWPSLLALSWYFQSTSLYWAGRDAYRVWTDPLGLISCPDRIRRAVDSLYATHSWPEDLQDCLIIWFGLHTRPTEIDFPGLHFLPGILPTGLTPPWQVYAAGLHRLGISPVSGWRQTWQDLFVLSQIKKRFSQALIFPGAGHPAKCWPLANYLKMASWLDGAGIEPVFVLGPAERERRLEVQNFQLLHPADFEQLQCALNHADLVLGNDSGPLHLAGLLNCKGVALFGPADAGQWGPAGLSHIQSGVPCSPCTRIGRIQCARPVCMDNISLQRIQKEIQALINEKRKKD